MMKSAIRYSTTWASVIAAVCIFTIGILFFVVTSQVNVQASDGKVSSDRLITIHDRGEERVILTKADSIQKALEDADIALDQRDAVEPALDEELVDTSYHVNIYRARPVIVSDGAVREKIMTPYQTSDKIVADAGMILNDEDITTVKPTADIISEGAGLELIIERATPFTFVLYGKQGEAFTQATTVGEMLEKKSIKMESQDELSVALDTPITPGMTVELWRNGKQTLTEEQVVPFTTEKVQDAAREVGYREIRTQGADGKRSVVYEIDIQNGREVSRKEIQSMMSVEPKKQVEVIGTKNKYSGTLNEWLLALRTCETGGVYTRNSGNGYYGAYQFLPATWDSIARKTGRPDLVGVRPDRANPADQDSLVIANAKASSGGLSTQHPGCYKKLGLSKFPPS